MKTKSRKHLACALTLIGSTLGACDDGKSTDTGGAEETPADVVRIEELAEDAYDKALISEFPAVVVDADEMDAAWQTYRPHAQADGAKSADISSMDEAIAQLGDAASDPVDPATVARAANAVSAGMDELFDLYHPVVPSDVLALDYLGREVVLDGMQMDFDAATADTDAMDARWTAVRGAVVRAGGTAEADEYDASIAAVRAAISAANREQLIDDANVGLEVVDAIEGVFEP